MGKKIAAPVTCAIIIVAFNDPHNLKRLLPSLAQLDTDLKLHLVVVDNSTDNTAADAIASLAAHAAKSLHATYHRQPDNLGFAGGVNQGIVEARGADYYWSLNSDTTVDPHALDALHNAARTTKAAIIGGQIVYADDKTVYYAGGTAHSWLGVVEHPRRNKPVLAHDPARFVTFVNGCSMFIPKATITTYGALYEPYFMYYEETDLCSRILARGGSLYYESAARIAHFTRHTDDKSANAVYYLTRNHWLYIARNIHGIRRVTASIAVTAFQVYRFVKYLTNPDLRNAIVHGLRDAAKHTYGPRH